MQPLHQTVQVTYRYSVYFTEQLFARDNTLLRDVLGIDAVPRKILCVVDQGLWRHHPDLLDTLQVYFRAHYTSLRLVCSPLIFQGGEDAKNNPANVAMVQEAIHLHGICRHSYVMAIGGGAVLDMVGYAAATAHRGVRLIRVPTTVLAQNDAGIGVKNSVNAFGKKNFLGTFAPPSLVFNDAHFLQTLSLRDWRCGIAEAIKVALLKDAAFFDFIEAQAKPLMQRDMTVMRQLIYRCAQLHLEHIVHGGDPFESGSSRPLDFGHWAAHKLEQLSGYTLRHGEAVAIGIALDSTYAYLEGWLYEQDWQRILELLSTLGFALFTPELSQYLDYLNDPRCIFSGLHEFREHLGGQLTLPLLEGIGRCIEVNDVYKETMKESIALLEMYQSSLQPTL
ncbi:MAG TPA: 3-dehydroquinate synthase [Ktedonosporobacter sp.]|jgi:3-dehydroquinate synthase|nr:3-dehydroquinate synthase [Ktedonosporobacter sp.]